VHSGVFGALNQVFDKGEESPVIRDKRDVSLVAGIWPRLFPKPGLFYFVLGTLISKLCQGHPSGIN